MKHNLKANKAIQYLGIALLILIIAFTSTAATFPTTVNSKSITEAAISKYIVAQSNPQLSDEEKVKAAIDAYFVTQYEGQKLLKVQDFSALIEDNTLDWVKKEKDKREIEIYIATIYNTPYVNYSFTLNYGPVDIDKKKAVVHLYENNEVVTLPDLITSKMANLGHTFTLHNKNGMWVIYKDEYQDELSRALDSSSKEELLQQVDKNRQQSSKQIQSYNKLVSYSYSPLGLRNYSYNRTRARDYANTYWSTYNTAYYATETEDCANYVAQSIYAGQGFDPPNTGGMKTGTRDYYQDWYYDYPTESGSLPWIQVIPQFEFITGIYGTRVGPYGSQQSGYCSLQPGDVIQIKTQGSGGAWDHEGIVVAASSPCVGMQSIYIDAHTTDHYYYPLIGWSAYPQRYVKISGWRK